MKWNQMKFKIQYIIGFYWWVVATLISLAFLFCALVSVPYIILIFGPWPTTDLYIFTLIFFYFHCHIFISEESESYNDCNGSNDYICIAKTYKRASFSATWLSTQTVFFTLKIDCGTYSSVSKFLHEKRHSHLSNSM